MPSPSPTTAAAAPSPIVQVGAPVLRARAAEVPPERIASAEIQALIAELVAQMRAAPGVGLAAPQLGRAWRIFVVEDREELIARLTTDERQERERTAVPLRVFINPRLRPVGAEKALFFEGCLSLHGFVGLVERSLEVEVEGYDKNGAEARWRVRGWPARILQHELDHLDGTLYIDRMQTRSFSTIAQAKELYGGLPMVEVRRRLGL